MSEKDNMFKPIETVRASQAVFEQIEGLILSKKLKKGQKLPSERQLMQIYHKSHQTIRESLRMLETMGYIEVNHGGAATVCYSSDKIMQENLLDLLQHGRITFQDIMTFICDTESRFIEGCVQNISWEDEIALDECMHYMENATTPIEHAMAYTKFHKTLIKITHNMILYIIWESFDQHMDTIKIKGTISLQEMSKSVELHSLLCKSLKEKNEFESLHLLEQISELYKSVLER